MFIKRFCSTMILLGILACIIFGNEVLSNIFFLILGSLIAFFVPYETCNMLKQAGKSVLTKTSSYLTFFAFFIVSLSCIIMNLFEEFEEFSDASVSFVSFSFTGCFLFLFLMLVLPWILLLFTIGKENGMEKILNSYGVMFLFIPAFIAMIMIYFEGRELFLFFVLGTKIGDIGAYITGSISNKLMKNGNHKMVPKISPKKSWEGAAGGLILSVVLAVLMYHYAFPGLSFGIWFPIVLGIFMFISGAAGDLAESCIKRNCGIKDSGTTIPGIGGVFDLVDSLLLNALLFLFLITLI